MADVYFYKGDTQCNDDGLSLTEVSSYLYQRNLIGDQSLRRKNYY